MAALESLQKRTADSGSVSGGVVEPRCWFEPAVKARGLTAFSWHCLRHTFASRLVIAGVDIRIVQELMGHKTISMTARYSLLAPKHTLSAVEKLGAQTREPTATTTATGTREQPKAEVVVLRQTA